MQSPSVVINWEKLKNIAEFIIAVSGIAAFLSLPFIDRLFVWMFKRNRESLKAQIDHMYHATTERRADMERDLDRLTLEVHGALASQAERDSVMMGKFSESFDGLQATLSAIHDEAQATARSVAHIYGLLEQDPWDGRTERRETKRRKED